MAVQTCFCGVFASQGPVLLALAAAAWLACSNRLGTASRGLHAWTVHLWDCRGVQKTLDFVGVSPATREPALSARRVLFVSLVRCSGVWEVLTDRRISVTGSHKEVIRDSDEWKDSMMNKPPVVTFGSCPGQKRFHSVLSSTSGGGGRRKAT